MDADVLGLPFWHGRTSVSPRSHVSHVFVVVVVRWINDRPVSPLYGTHKLNDRRMGRILPPSTLETPFFLLLLLLLCL